MNDRPDEELVVASRSGDREAYAALVRRHSRQVYAVCLALLGSAGDSEDIAQETLVRGWTHIGTLRDGSRFPWWITRIARNLCRDHLRSRRRRRELLENPPDPGSPLFGAAGSDPGEAGGGIGEATGLSAELQAALARLPAKHRMPLMLFYFDGQSSESVARALGISRAGACTRLSRARKALRRLIEAQKGQGGSP